jgi:hypothetical protein
LLTDINLLPQKETRSILFVIILTLLLSFGMLGSTFILLQYQQLVEEVEMKQEQLRTIIKLREMQEAKIYAEESSSNAAQQYEQLLAKVEVLPLPTLTILNEFTAFLPLHGYFNSYTYSDEGSIRLAIEFPTLEEAAGYLHHLTYAEWIDKVEMPTVSKNGKGGFIAQYQVQLNKPYYHPTREEVQ